MDISKIDTISKSLNELIGATSSMVAKAPPKMRPAIEKEIRRMMPLASQMPVLALIDKEGEVYGYEIMKLAERLHIRGLGASRVYPMLHRMERGGLLRSRWAGRKKVYRVTASGKKYIAWWKESLKMGISIKVRMLKLIFNEEVRI